MLNRRTFLSLTAITASGAVLSACAPAAPTQPNIRAVIDANQALTTLARLLANAGVTELGETGPFTVFAPTNNAFAALPQGEIDRLLETPNRAELTRLMQLHVVAGRYLASDLVNRTTTLTTLSGLKIIVDGFNGVTVGGVTVIQPDVMASNGIIHVINGIIKPAAA